MAQHGLASAVSRTVLPAKSAQTGRPTLSALSCRRDLTSKAKVNPVASSRAVTRDRAVSIRTMEQHTGTVSVAGTPIAGVAAADVSTAWIRVAAVVVGTADAGAQAQSQAVPAIQGSSLPRFTIQLHSCEWGTGSNGVLCDACGGVT